MSAEAERALNLLADYIEAYSENKWQDGLAAQSREDWDEYIRAKKAHRDSLKALQHLSPSALRLLAQPAPAQAEALRAENERLRTALEWYADGENFNSPYTEQYPDGSWGDGPIPVLEDDGDRACAALAATGEGA